MNTDTIVKAAWFDLMSNQIAQGAALGQALNEAQAKVKEVTDQVTSLTEALTAFEEEKTQAVLTKIARGD